MSFLSILFFASAFYVAHARPDSTTGWGFAPSASDNGTTIPKEQIEPVMHASQYQEQLGALMEELNKSFDQYMTPIMTKLDVVKQEKLKLTCLNGFASYINYWILLVEEQLNEGSKYDDDTKGFKNSPLYGDDIILEFDALDPFDMYSPFIKAEEPKN